MNLKDNKPVIKIVAIFITLFFLNSCISQKFIKEVNEDKIYDFLNYYFNNKNKLQDTLYIKSISYNNWNNYIRSGYRPFATKDTIINVFSEKFCKISCLPVYKTCEYTSSVLSNLSALDIAYLNKQISTNMIFDASKFSLNKPFVIYSESQMSYEHKKKIKERRDFITIISKPIFTLNEKICFMFIVNSYSLPNRNGTILVYKKEKGKWNEIGRFIIDTTNR